jgi:hypothetical protein
MAWQKSGVCDGLWAEAFFCLVFLFTFSSMEKVKAQRLERRHSQLQKKYLNQSVKQNDYFYNSVK